MRVLHVIPSLDPKDGGPSVALPMMARALVMEGIEVDVAATMTAADAAAQGVKFGEPVIREGFAVRFFRRQTSFYKMSLPLRSWLRSHAGDYDLLHNHGVFSFAPLAAATAARRARVPYIMRPLGLLNAWGMEKRRRRVKALSFRLFDRPALDHAAALHYTSTDERDEAARLNLKSRAVVVPLGIDLEPYRVLPSAEAFHERFPTTRDREIVLFLSRVDPKKGLEELLPAVANLQMLRSRALLVIAGDGHEDYIRYLKEIVVRESKNQDVLWTGMIGGELKLAAFAAAKIFALPSRSENFGIALLEAMASGLPCVSTKGVALARTAAAEGAVLLCAPEKNELRDALAGLFGDDGARKRMGETARKVAMRDYSLDAMGRNLGALYRRILNGETI